ncbi:MAG: hypothetical protein ACOWYE_05495 [Desulfatiglandales bacterium]
MTRKIHGNDFTFYLPGMVRYGRERGRYPAISITGAECQLLCEHCKGRLLDPMIKVTNAAAFLSTGKRFERSGAFGLLLSGGSDHRGRLPWHKYFGAISGLCQETLLYLSAHTGFPDPKTCHLLKESGVRQALLDVMGDEETAKAIYHLEGMRPVLDAMEGICDAGLQFVPHIVAGLSYGRISAEYKAIEMISRYAPSALVIVVLTPLKGTPMAHVSPPAPLEIARLIARARCLMPEIPIALGCERPRNRDGLEMERLSIMAGATRMAVWSEESIAFASQLGLRPRFQLTCCSLEYRVDFSSSGPQPIS